MPLTRLTKLKLCSNSAGKVLRSFGSTSKYLHTLLLVSCTTGVVCHMLLYNFSSSQPQSLLRFESVYCHSHFWAQQPPKKKAREKEKRTSASWGVRLYAYVTGALLGLDVCSFRTTKGTSLQHSLLARYIRVSRNRACWWQEALEGALPTLTLPRRVKKAVQAMLYIPGL